MMFEFKVNGEKYELRNPTAQEHKKADLIYSEVFSNALREGVMTDDEMRKIINERKILSDDENKTIEDCDKKIQESEEKIEKLKQKDKKIEVATQLMNLRYMRNIVMSHVVSMLNNTAENIANSEKLKWLTFTTLVDKDGNPVYTDYDEFSNSKDVVATTALRHFIYINAGIDSNNPNIEDKVLKEIGYIDEEGYRIDDKGRLINDDAKLIDRLYRLVDENGFLVDDKGKFIDEEGNPVEDGKKVKGRF